MYSTARTCIEEVKNSNWRIQEFFSQNHPPAPVENNSPSFRDRSICRSTKSKIGPFAGTPFYNDPLEQVNWLGFESRSRSSEMRLCTILVGFLTHPSQCEPSFHHCCRISPNSPKPTHSMIWCSDSIRAVLIVKEMPFRLKWLLRFHHLAIWISPTPPIELSLETKNIFSTFQFWYPPHF